MQTHTTVWSGNVGEGVREGNLCKGHDKCTETRRLEGCLYRTVSEAAVLVIVGIIPIRLLAKERKLIYDRKNEGDAQWDKHTLNWDIEKNFQ